MTNRSEMRGNEAGHRIVGQPNPDPTLIPQHYFTFPRRSGIPYGYFKRRSAWPIVGMTILCWLAFGAVVAMIYAGVK